MRNGQDPRYPLCTGTLRRELNAVVSYASNGAWTIRWDSRVRVVGIASGRKCRHSAIDDFARCARDEGFFRALRDVDYRFVLVNNCLLRASAVRVVRYFHRSNDSSVIEYANFGLREGFVRDHFFGESVLGRLSSSLMEQGTIRPFFLSVGCASAYQAVCFVDKRRRGVNVRVLCIRFRIESELDYVGRAKCAINVYYYGRFLRQVRHARCIQRVRRASGLHTFKRWFFMFIRRRFTFIIRQGRFSYGAFADDRGLPKSGVAVVFRCEGSRLVPFLRGLIAGAKGGRICTFHYSPYRRRFAHTTNVSGLACHFAEYLIRFHDLL